MSPTQIHVGNLHCQRDPYCREFQTTCIDCSEKPDKKGFYTVKLYDTSNVFLSFKDNDRIIKQTV